MKRNPTKIPSYGAGGGHPILAASFLSRAFASADGGLISDGDAPRPLDARLRGDGGGDGRCMARDRSAPS